MSSNGLAERVEIKSSSSVSVESVLALVPLEISAGEVTPESGSTCGSELDNEWTTIMGDPRVDSNCANMGDESGGNGEARVGFGFVAVSTVNSGYSST